MRSNEKRTRVEPVSVLLVFDMLLRHDPRELIDRDILLLHHLNEHLGKARADDRIAERVIEGQKREEEKQAEHEAAAAEHKPGRAAAAVCALCDQRADKTDCSHKKSKVHAGREEKEQHQKTADSADDAVSSEVKSRPDRIFSVPFVHKLAVFAFLL